MGGDSWYDAVELTKFNASDNEIAEIDERFGEEFIALNTIDVSYTRNITHTSFYL
jgi:hypothetical protein